MIDFWDVYRIQMHGISGQATRMDLVANDTDVTPSKGLVKRIEVHNLRLSRYLQDRFGCFMHGYSTRRARLAQRKSELPLSLINCYRQSISILVVASTSSSCSTCTVISRRNGSHIAWSRDTSMEGSSIRRNQ